MMTKRAWRWLMFGACVVAAGLGLSGIWIHAKAALAQVLLARAWVQSDHGRQLKRPWPWADIAPIARLSVPRLDQSLIVLNNDSGQALAFGPGWTPSSARPAGTGLSVISGHRDTQFSFLKALRPGDLVRVDGPNGSGDYRVAASQIVDSRHRRLPASTGPDRLWLVTCYPFDAVVPGGPLRYVVQAERMSAATPANFNAAGTNRERAGQLL